VEKIKELIEIKKWSKLKAAFNLGVSHTQVRHLLSLVEAPKEAN